MEVDYKYQTEYAKSNRSTCRACKLSINQGSLRMAVLVQSSTFDGKMPLWFHFHCFFKKSKVISTSDIKNFDGLKFEDQEKIRNAMKTDVFDLGNFGLKRLGESKDKCTSCSKVISDPFFVDGKKRELGTAYHVKCFVKKHPSVDMHKISGLSKLNAQDRADLFDAVANVKPASNKRPNSANGDEVNAKKAKLEDPNKEALRKQSEHMWKLHNALETEVTKDALVGLLEYNDQHVPTGLAALLDAVVDGMVFGALLPCPACKNCSLTYSNGEYRCMGMASEWARCIYSTREPKRRPFRVPKEYHDATVLRTFKYKPRTRIFAATDDGVQAAKTAFSKKTPLGGLNFLIGKGPFANDQTARDIASTVKKLGGAIILEPSNGAILITSEEEMKSPVEARRKFIERASYAHMRPICVRSLDLLRKAKSPEEVEGLINENLLSDWRSGGNTRSDGLAVVPANSASGKASQHRSLDQEMREAVVKMRIKGGAVVDPDSGMEDIASVLKDSKGRPLSAILGMVDLVKGVNSYYRLQVLVSDKEPKRYWVFRAWGRTGTTIGGNKIESFANAHSATEHFEDLYREKTGNYWGTRKEDFEKIPFKFYPLEMDYGEESTKTKGEEIHHIPSKLEVRIQALMRFLFDEVSMQNALREFEIDIRKMPLGKLSKNQIREAYGILGELSKLLSTKPPKSEAAIASRHTALISNSTQFFTLIPHDFGLKAPPVLDSLDVIKTKSRMLEDLLEMEVAYSLMKTDDSHVNPLDDHYAKLHNRIEPLDHESKEFLRIVEYMQKTHASTHSAYTLEVVDIFSVEREGEAERYQAFKDLSNKMLLWHGSRRTNWAGILAQGLRIAPPEAPVTGYMFGKGIYFADMCSKSANYCFPSHETPQGCLLLCEVALGNMHECSTADDSKLKNEYNSRKGVGATCPDPDTYYTDENGVVYPTGQPKSTAVSGHLLYNEFIVYNTAQVRQKYLVWVNFKFK